MFLLNVVRGAAALAVGVVITLLCLSAALLCAACRLPANWAAKLWGWLGYWVEFRALGGIQLVTQFNGARPTKGQPVVLFGTHPLDPALQAWVYSLSQQFPGRHFAPTARNNHPLSKGFKAIGGAVLNIKNGLEAIFALREWLSQQKEDVVLTIFPDVHRWTPDWHRQQWTKAVRRGEKRLSFTLPWKGGGLREIQQALPQAAFYRCIVCFDRTAWGWKGFFQVSGSTLQIRYDRVEPPRDQEQFHAWINQQAAEADRITGNWKVR